MNGLVLFALLLAACGGGDPADADQADSAAPLSAFTLQFTGRYEGAATLELRRDGSFFDGPEHGRFYTAPSRRELPLEIRFRGSQGSWTAVIDAYDGMLRAAREGRQQTLQLVRPQAADEELCDQTRGQWTDDDADPATGLYCVCSPGAWFIPSSGGCVP